MWKCKKVSQLKLMMMAEAFFVSFLIHDVADYNRKVSKQVSSLGKKNTSDDETKMCGHEK